MTFSYCAQMTVIFLCLLDAKAEYTALMCKGIKAEIGKTAIQLGYLVTFRDATAMF